LHPTLRTSDRLAAELPTCVGVAHPARPAITPDSHLALLFSSAGISASGFRRSPLQLSACADCCCNLQLALVIAPFCHTGCERLTRVSCSSAGFAGFNSLGLRRSCLRPVGPLTHPLFQPNLASPAEPSMSIPFPLVRASSGSASFLTTSDLRRLLQSLWRDQRSLCGFRLRFHPLAGLALITRLSSTSRFTNRSGVQLPMPYWPSVE
jgi:hypothetical protein